MVVKVREKGIKEHSSNFDLELEEEAPELVDIESWFLREDILYKYECEHFDQNDIKHPR